MDGICEKDSNTNVRATQLAFASARGQNAIIAMLDTGNDAGLGGPIVLAESQRLQRTTRKTCISGLYVGVAVGNIISHAIYELQK